MFFAHKYALWGCQAFFKIPSFAEPQAEQSNRHVELSGPLRNALSISEICIEILACFYGSVAEIWLNRKGFFDWPSITNPPSQCRYSKFAGPFSNKFCLALKRHIHIILEVSLLLFWRGPLTIFLVVPTRAINSIYCVSVRALAHVGKKVGKRFSPTTTYNNSNSTVFWVFIVPWPMAPTNHVLISCIGLTLPFFGCVSVGLHNKILSCKELIVGTKPRYINTSRRAKEMALCLTP